jgi:hypothetical protein
MIATRTGVVKDVYQGPEQRFRITGLKPNTEYILCVKVGPLLACAEKFLMAVCCLACIHIPQPLFVPPA